MERFASGSPTRLVIPVRTQWLAGSKSSSRLYWLRCLLCGMMALADFVSDPVAAVTPPSESSPAGYTMDLLDESLSRWVVTQCVARCDGSMLTIEEGNGFVRSAHPYSDFILELEYRPGKERDYDSGLFFRCSLPPSGKPWPERYQINWRDGQEGQLVGTAGTSAVAWVKRGEWNHIKLTCVGHSARLEVNGHLAWQVDTIEPLSGFIGIQAEVPQGGTFQVRNVRITELGFRSLFNGQDLQGWEPASPESSTTWQVSDGLLQCTGHRGPWLRSKEEFSDFNLRLEYRVQPGGNSGVYIRVPADGNHHGANAGIEVQILDDAAPQYSNLKPYQYCGSLYAVKEARQRVTRPAGTWNVLEIDCRGMSYVVRHNGHTVVEAEGTLVPELKQRRVSGFLGLQNHSEPVEFRHLRVGPSLQPPDAARPVSELLNRNLLTSDQTLHEVQQFCRARVARLPAAESPQQWNEYVERLRNVVLERVVFRGEAARWRHAATQVEWLDELPVASEYRIKKLRFEALPGLWVPALLYEPVHLEGKVPVFLNVNGHDSLGKAAVYKQIRCINLAKRGILALNVEWYGMGQLRGEGFVHYRMNQLDLCGTSGLAPFVLAMQRALDVLLAHPHADPARVGVAGLSGGGWQTITIAALDTRVSLANPVAGYSSFLTRIDHFSDLGDSEQTPVDLAAYADYTHYTAMLAPRYALLTYNSKDDCCFASGHALPPLLEAARPVYRLLEAEDRLMHHINNDPGTHNFERDNREALYRAVQAAFFPGDGNFSAVEIACDQEIQTPEQLFVPLPENNLDFHQLALQLAANLPRDRQTPQSEEDTAAWQSRRRTTLSQIVRYHGEYSADAIQEEQSTWRGRTVVHRQLRIQPDWTLPVVEIAPPAPVATAILLSESGRTALDQPVQLLLDQGYRVLAVDPFYWGESRISQRDFLFALLVSSVGERPLGIQASQINALARWVTRRYPDQPLEIAAYGPRSALAATVAAALEPNLYRRVELHGALTSLKTVLENNVAVNQSPEYFCFGLLQHFDMDGLIYLAGQDRVQMREN